MGRIKIGDIPVHERSSREEKKGILGGLAGGVGSRVKQLSALTALVIYPVLNVTM